MESGIFFELKTLEQEIFRTFFNLDDVSKIKRPSPTQMRIIAYILNHKDTDVYQRDLEGVLNLRRATVSEVLRTMEKNGLISRAVSESDTRVKKIILEKKTNEIFQSKRKTFEEIEKTLEKNISKEDLNNFKKVIKQMISNIEYTKEERKSI